MLILKDIIDVFKNQKIDHIEIRTNCPFDAEKDILFGTCAWDGKKIISLDGYDYQTYMAVDKWNWKVCDNTVKLIVFIRTNWFTNNEIAKKFNKIAERYRPLENLRIFPFNDKKTGDPMVALFNIETISEEDVKFYLRMEYPEPHKEISIMTEEQYFNIFR